MSLLEGREKEIGIISIILIIVCSNGLLFYFQNITANDLTKSVFEQQRQLLMQYTGEIARHISSDVSLVVDNLHGLANSIYLQQGNLSSNIIKKLVENTYVHLSNDNNIIDRLVIADKSGFEKIGLVVKGQKSFAGTNVSSRPWIKETIASKTVTFSNGFAGLDGKYRMAIGYPITNLENGQYMGVIGALIPFESFLLHYENIHNATSKYLVAYDKKGTY